MLQRFGFFEENPQTALADLEDLKRLGPVANEDLVIRYLSSGTMLFEASGCAFDFFSGGTTPIGPPHVYSDGEWCWSGDVMYYLRKHHIAIEPQFIHWMAKHDWKCPRVVSAEALVQSNWLT